MLVFILRRLLAAIPVLFGITVLVFLISKIPFGNLLVGSAGKKKKKKRSMKPIRHIII